MNITDALFTHAQERPAHPEVEDGGRIISYFELAAMVGRAATRLEARGIGAGDVVIVALPDTAEHVVLLLTLAKIGAVSFSIDERTPDVDRSKAVRNLQIKCAVVRDGITKFLDIATCPISALFADPIESDAGSPSFEVPVAFDDNLPLMVVQSSGSTGDPKRLMLTHRQLAERNRALAAILGLSSADRYLQVPYLRFSLGRELALLMMTLGATIVLNHGTAKEDYSRYFSERDITYVSFTPFHLRTVLSCVTGDTPSWPRLKIGVGSAPVMPEERLSARRRLTPQLFEFYGTNEVADLTVATPDDQDRFPDSCGRLIDGIDAQVVDENHAPLPFGKIGELRFRGPLFPRAYSENPEATARQFRDGWFYPGDLGAMNEQGYVFYKGRTDQAINNAGVKYFPAEVEAVLLTHPSVVDVAVIGGSHPVVGEATVAYVVRSSNVAPNELYQFCSGKIDRYKAPHWVFFLDELPRVATGKPDKKRLKEMFLSYLKSSTA